MIHRACIDTEYVAECDVIGNGYCPEVSCQSGESMAFDNSTCTDVYCLCGDPINIWEEEVRIFANISKLQVGTCFNISLNLFQ